MFSLVVIVPDVFTHRAPKMAFAEQNNLSQALRLDRTHETLGVRVEVRASARKPHEPDARTLDRRLKSPREQRISIVDQVAAPRSDYFYSETIGGRDGSSMRLRKRPPGSAP